MEIKYQVILTIDIYDHHCISRYKPKFLNKKSWRVTEKTGDESDGQEHRKYCAILSSTELKIAYEELIEQYSISTCQTMGAITEYGCLPAISWDVQLDDSARLNAYVSPMPELSPEEVNAWKALIENERTIKNERINKRIDEIMEFLHDVNEEYEAVDPDDFTFPETIETDFLQTELII